MQYLTLTCGISKYEYLENFNSYMDQTFINKDDLMDYRKTSLNIILLQTMLHMSKKLYKFTSSSTWRGFLELHMRLVKTTLAPYSFTHIIAIEAELQSSKKNKEKLNLLNEWD